MLVCDNCRKPGKIHPIQFGYPYYEELKEKKTEIAAFYGIKGEYCETCINDMLEEIGYKHETKINYSDKAEEELK